MTSMPTTVRTPRRPGTRGKHRPEKSQSQKKARRAAQRWCRRLRSEKDRRNFQMLLDRNKETPLGVIIVLINCKYKPKGSVRTYLERLVDEIDDMQSRQ